MERLEIGNKMDSNHHPIEVLMRGGRIGKGKYRESAGGESGMRRDVRRLERLGRLERLAKTR